MVTRLIITDWDISAESDPTWSSSASATICYSQTGLVSSTSTIIMITPDKLIIVDTRTSPGITSSMELRSGTSDSTLDTPIVPMNLCLWLIWQCAPVCPSVSQCDECYQHHARCLGGALVLPGLLQGRWNLLCQCYSVTVLHTCHSGSVIVSSCHQATVRFWWSMCSTAANMVNIGTKEFLIREQSLGGRSNIPPGGDNIWCYITSPPLTSHFHIINHIQYYSLPAIHQQYLHVYHSPHTRTLVPTT